MGKAVIGGACAVVVFAVIGCGGSGGVVQSSPPSPPARSTATAAEAGGLVDRALLVEQARCAPNRGLRFHCVLPDLRGSADIELRRTGGGFLIRGCPPAGSVCTLLDPGAADRTVAEESSAERHAAGLLDSGFGELVHVTCARATTRHFDCDGIFRNEAVNEAVNVDLEIVKRRFYFARDCRVTKVWSRTIPLACQRLTWNINFPQSEMLEMSRGPVTVEGRVGR